MIIDHSPLIKTEESDEAIKAAYKIDYAGWKAREKPFGISGCFRLRNEAEFMVPSVESHLPYLDEAVLLIQPSEDGTEEIALDLAEKHPDKVRVYWYPFIVDWIDTPGFYNNDPDQPGHMVHMSNYALSLCRFSWISKSEGDVIALPPFQKIVDRVRNDPDDIHYYGRVILNVAGEKCDMVSATNPRNGGWDEAVFNNDPDRFRFVRSGKWEVIPMGNRVTCMGWSALHMKRCKKKYIGWNNERLVRYTPGAVRAALYEFNLGSPYPGNDDFPLGDPSLFEWRKGQE